MPIASMKMMASKNRSGPTESRAGRAQWRMPAAIIVRTAGQRGARDSFGREECTTELRNPLRTSGTPGADGPGAGGEGNGAAGCEAERGVEAIADGVLDFGRLRTEIDGSGAVAEEG